MDQLGQELQSQLQTTQDDNHVMQEELDQRAQEVLDYQQTIRALTNAIHRLETMTPAGIGPPPRPQELPAPPRFNGNRDDLLSWKTSVNVKLTGDASRFTNDQHCLSYIFNLLDGRARNQIQGYVRNNRIDLMDVPALFIILD